MSQNEPLLLLDGCSRCCVPAKRKVTETPLCTPVLETRCYLHYHRAGAGQLWGCMERSPLEENDTSPCHCADFKTVHSCECRAGALPRAWRNRSDLSSTRANTASLIPGAKLLCPSTAQQHHLAPQNKPGATGSQSLLGGLNPCRPPGQD